MHSIDFAIVHHANQYIITNGYPNREGLDDVLGIGRARTGYLKILELHREYQVPFNLHLSGTLLEAILWHRPDFLEQLRNLNRQGVLDFVCSSYGQNIMRFFDYRHNIGQVNECLRLYRELLGLDPGSLKVFWPPERIWDTKRLVPVLTSKELLNNGYRQILIDDRLLYPAKHGMPSRRVFDEGLERSCADFCAYRIVRGNGLTALPISSFLRQHIPPRDAGSLERLDELCRWLAEKGSSQADLSLIAIYGDDLEKSSGCCGWDPGGPAQYETFLKWLVRNPSLRPVKLNEWGSSVCVARHKPIEVGSYFEMSRRFGAGEGYEKWYFDPLWKLYRGYYSWSEAKVAKTGAKGGDPALLAMARKHLLASCWETAWHIPSFGVHGDPSSANEPSPWAKALTSHSRHAAVIAEAANWMKHKDGTAWACLEDIDNDGHEELILKNELLFAVFSPAYGGRLVYLFDIGGAEGKMVIGNPSDDWNWLEELNRYMRVPANHPGALAETGYEDDCYEAAVNQCQGEARAVLTNARKESRAEGLKKSLRLVQGKNEIEVAYQLPENLPDLAIECGLSPDYAHLLRSDRSSLKELVTPDSRGFSNNGVSVWVRLEDPAKTVFDPAATAQQFGHGCAIRVLARDSPFTLWIGTGPTG